MIKFVLFLAIAIFAVQGLEPSSAEIISNETNGIIDIIKAVIEKLRDIISNIDIYLGEFIKKLADKIKQIVDNIEESIKDFKQKIEEFIRKYGEPARKCFFQLKSQFDEILYVTRGGVLGCIRKANEQLTTIKGDVSTLIKNVVNFQNDINDRVLNCVKEAKWNVQKLKECLKHQVGPISEEFDQLQKEVAATIEATKGVVIQAKTNLDKCVNNVKVEVSEKEKRFAENFAKCIANNQ